MSTPIRLSLLALLAAFPLACAATPDAQTDDSIDEAAIDDELTSVTALARTMTFQGVVYVDASASDATILSAVRRQTQSAFGALRTANVGVNDRELKSVDAKTFVKKTVTVVDASGAKTTMQQVKYSYTTNAVVPKTMARRSALGLAMLNGDYGAQLDRITTECTANDSEAREFRSDIWYVFDPSLSSCSKAMAKEQATIDADRKKLASSTYVAASETKRLYLPMTVSLVGQKTSTGTTYPEYDRLYAGGVAKGRLVVSMVSGLMADWAAGEHHDTIDDEGYDMWFQGLRAIFAKRPEFQLANVAGGVDLLSYDLGGTKVTASSFADLIAWELDGAFPSNVPASKQHDLRVAVGEKIVKRWITFEAPMTVTIGGVSKDVTLQLNSYFGAETDPTPHKWAVKHSDVFVYNGHSYIGYGPLDPSNFTSSDFPSSYQIMFVNGCVSYNYYEHDYFPLKSGGTRNLELVTNGLESWVDGSGPAMGRFVGALLDGKQESYTSLLKAAQFTDYGYSWGMDALRVVDGELDNVYSPKKTPISVKSR